MCRLITETLFLIIFLGFLEHTTLKFSAQSKTDNVQFRKYRSLNREDAGSDYFLIDFLSTLPASYLSEGQNITESRKGKID